MNIKTVLL